MTAFVTFTQGFQPVISPSSVAKLKTLFTVLPCIGKPAVGLKTMPVGSPWSLPGAAGIVRTNDCGFPAPSYNVDLPVPLSDTQTKAAGLKAMPQPFTRWVSLWSAERPGIV